MTENKQEVRQRPGFFTRFFRALGCLLSIIVFAAIIGVGYTFARYGTDGLAQIQADIFKVFTDIDHDRQKLDRVAIDVESQQSQIELLRSDVGNLMEARDDQTAQIFALSNMEGSVDTNISNFDGRMDVIEAQLEANMETQADLLANLEASVAELAATNSEQGDNIGLLSNSIATLQADINDGSVRLDELGGEVDNLTSKIDSFDGALADAQLAQAEATTSELSALRADLEAQDQTVAQLQQATRTLRYFRVWEWVTRAQVHLLEGNAGIARTDIANAQQEITDIAELDEQAGQNLTAIFESLTEANDALPAEPADAARSLDDASDALDTLIGNSLNNLEATFAPSVAISDTADITSTIEITDTVTVTDTELITATVTVTDTATISDTAVVTGTAETSVIGIELTGLAAERDAEYSGMAWYGDQLILMPQYPNFFDETSEGVIFAIASEDLLAYLSGDSDAPLEPTEIPFSAPDLADSIEGFEGYESIVFVGDTAYLTIEVEDDTGTFAYIISGTMADDLSGLTLDPETLVEIPTQAGISNLSDETILAVGDSIVTIHEANGVGVNASPVAHVFGVDLSENAGTIPMANIEYRVTDATDVDADGRFWAINYFFPGDEALLPEADPLLDEVGEGTTHLGSDGVERLVEFQYSEDGITLTDTPPIQLELMDDGSLRNWEGIVRFEGIGFLIVTDKFPTTILGFVPLPLGEDEVATDSDEAATDEESAADDEAATDEEATTDESSTAAYVGPATVNTSFSNLNMREAPEATAEIVVRIPPNSIVQVLGEQATDDSGNVWFEVEYEDQIGWVISRWLTLGEG